MTLLEKREKYAGLITQLREINERPEKEGREFNADDEQAYENCHAEVSKLRAEIDRLDKQEKLERDLKEPTTRSVLDDDDSGETRTAPDADEERSRAAFESYLGRGREGMSGKEQRGLTVDVDTEGGYIVAPQVFVNKLIKAVDNLVFMRKMATVHSIPKAESLGAPSLDADPADPTWTSEALIGSEDSTMAFGKRELHPHPLGQFIKVSRTLLRKASIGPEALVRNRLAYKLAVVQETAFLTGTGANQPLGVFTASADGIPTGRDVSSGNTSSSMTPDGLKNARWSLKPAYWARAAWIFHTDGAKQIDKLKDGEGRYMLSPNLREGPADKLLGRPMHVSAYAPSTFTSGLYVGILGDFSNYWIADSLNIEIQRLVELYAAANKVGFISRIEADGMPVLAEAFARVKLG